MVRIAAAPAAIEGSEIEIRAQSISPAKSPIYIITGEMVFPIAVKIRGIGEILVENNPKVRNFRDYSNLDKGDEILGDNLWGFSSFPVTKINIGQKGRTSAHSGLHIDIDGGKCFLEIVSGAVGNAIANHPRNYFLRKVNNRYCFLLS